MKIKMNRLYIWGILVIALFVSRFLDFSILFSLGNREHHFFKMTPFYQKNCDSIYYENIGFSSWENAKEILLKISKEEENQIFIVNFYDFICPIRYLIFNKGSKAKVELPWIQRDVDGGLTEINIYKYEYFQVKTKDNIECFFNPVVGAPWFFLYEIERDYNKALKSDKLLTGELTVGLSYFYYGNSIFIKEIYLFYFYLPLVGILILSRKYKIHLAYLYFFILLILFAPKFLISYGIGLGLADGVYEIPIIKMIFPFVITILMGVFFIKNIRDGLKNFKERKLEFKEKMIVLYFLLLPLFLRF